MRSFVGGVIEAVTNRAPVPYNDGSGLLYGALPDLTATGERQLAQYGQVSTLQSVIRRRAEAVAAVDWELIRTSDGRGRLSMPGVENPRRADPGQPAAKLWARPNPFMTRSTFVETTHQHLDLIGETVWVKVRTGMPGLGSAPIELWPVRPDRMQPAEHPTEFISGWVYTTPTGRKVPFDVADVIQIKLPNPMDPYRGMGPIQALLAELDTQRYSAEWNRAFFQNSAEPGGVLQFKEPLQDHEFKRTLARWNEQHQGARNAHRTAIIEGGEYKTIQFSMRDMQFAELRNINREIIREAYGMSKTMLGLTEDVNRATAEASEYVHAKYATSTSLRRYCEALDTRLLPDFGLEQSHEFAHDDPVPENIESAALERDSLVGAAMRIIEAGGDPAATLEAFGLPPIPWKEPQPVPAALGGPPEDDNDEEQ